MLSGSVQLELRVTLTIPSKVRSKTDPDSSSLLPLHLQLESMKKSTFVRPGHGVRGCVVDQYQPRGLSKWIDPIVWGNLHLLVLLYALHVL